MKSSARDLAKSGFATAFQRGEATGNRFLVWDRLADAADERSARAEEAELAPALCDAFTVDGLLTLDAQRSGGDLRMILHNADGGRAEACGNGLRLLACVWHARYSADPARPLVIETDAGPRRAWPLPDPDGRARRARVSLGTPRLLASDEILATPAGEVLAHVVDVGNPHCVLLVSDLARIDVQTLGPALERHPRFPQRTNVEFVERTAENLRLRVFERGVGETASCGSGVVAAAFVARRLHAMADPIRVETRGGHLRVSFDDRDEAFLEGPAEGIALLPEERERLGGILSR